MLVISKTHYHCTMHVSFRVYSITIIIVQSAKNEFLLCCINFMMVVIHYDNANYYYYYYYFFFAYMLALVSQRYKLIPCMHIQTSVP